MTANFVKKTDPGPDSELKIWPKMPSTMDILTMLLNRPSSLSIFIPCKQCRLAESLRRDYSSIITSGRARNDSLSTRVVGQFAPQLPIEAPLACCGGAGSFSVDVFFRGYQL